MQAASPGGVTRSLTLRLAAAAAFAALAGCGSMGELRPAEGKSLPVKPLMAQTVPTPAELLTPPAFANPDRVDELMRKSAPRKADRFDLPPPSGQAPAAPVQTLDDEPSEDPDPTNPT